MNHGNLAKDACIYTPEAVRVGLILFPSRTCSHCHVVLPANTDYFVPRKARAGECTDGLACECRRCRRELARARHRRRRAEEQP